MAAAASWPWLILSPLVLLIILFTRRSISRALPPGPFPLPVIGNFIQIGSETLVFRGLSKMAAKYGPIMTLYFGSLRTIVISSPQGAKEVLQDFDSSCCSRFLTATARIFVNNGKDIVFAAGGAHLQTARRLCAINLFNKRLFDSWRPLRLDEVTHMCDAIKNESELTGGVVCLRNHIFRAAVNHILRLSVGKRFGTSVPGQPNSEGDKFFRWMKDTFQVVGGVNVGDFVPIFWFLDFQGIHAIAQKVAKEFDDFVTSHVKEHEKHLEFVKSKLKEGVDGDPDGSVPLAKDLCDALLLAKDIEQIDDEVVLGVLKDMLLAGSETTSITTEWAMLELIRHPEKLSQLRLELDSVFDLGQISDIENRIMDLPYLQAVVKEALRLHTPVPLLIPHLSTKEVKLGEGKYTIPKDTMIMINAWSICHDERYWPEPFEFKPERFLDNPINFRGQDFSLIPFGSGRRMCPGMNVGVTMVTLMIAHLVRNFDFSTPLGKLENTEEMGLTVPPLKPLEAVVKPRF